MRTILSIIQKCILSSAVIVLSSFTLLSSSTVFADSTTPCVAPANNQNGVHWPVGADASTFIYQCEGTYAGFWTNTYYKYDPVTTQRYALYSPDYSYDCSTKQWSMTEWDYSPASGTFISTRVTPSVAPDIATNCPVPPPTTETAPTNSSTPTPSIPTASVTTTGPASQNTANTATTLNTTSDNKNTATVTNGLYSNATTGNTFVIGNTTGGSASSGDAQSIANVANLLQSTGNVFGPNTTVFTANINGNVTGDFMFDPNAIISTSGPASQNSTGNALQINTNTSNATNAQINNTVNVAATTGNATVTNNTTGGNATSGNATAVADVMNLINSTVAAGHSFVGTVNINGNLNGDILLPQNFINQLLASSGPSSTTNLSSNVAGNSTTTNNTTAAISNDIANTALSGGATVANNTSAGNARSGSANTNVTLLNLTGSNVVGQNDLLVFVNVLGHWVGMIVDAPVGATSASLGGGITSTGPASNNAATNTLTANDTTTNTANLGIHNAVNVLAQSGNALVSNNTHGGSATSGNAQTAINLLNIAGSNINLSSWFGILFINVFGDWTGSFGINTSAGDPLNNTVAGVTTISSTTPNPALAQSVHQFATFVSHSLSNSTNSTAGTSTNQPASTASSVLGASIQKVADNVTQPTKSQSSDGTHGSYTLPAVGLGIAALMMFSEGISAVRKKH